ncbi:MAG: HAD-IB family phosphatase [Coxiellaceae bacterium]|nr:HAD-IB family phosphatase [Coxiellaceae bacterium]
MSNQQPFDAVVFDCDGTLSSIEGIVELARWNGVEDSVEHLTEQAMAETGMTPDIYRQRIEATRPTRQQCEQLADAYYQQRTPAIDHVITQCQQQGIAIFVISAGVNPAVQLFAEKLTIPEDQVFAVDLDFDDEGNYLDYDHTSPMTTGGGKRIVVEQIKQAFANILYVGDGQNDLDVYDDVKRFVGYGGAYYRENIEKVCEHYITEKSMQPLLALMTA